MQSNTNDETSNKPVTIPSAEASQILNKMELIKPQRNWMADLHQRKIPTDPCT